MLTTEKQNFFLFDITTHPVVEAGIKEKVIQKVKPHPPKVISHLLPGGFAPRIFGGAVAIRGGSGGKREAGKG